jgi:SSS family solute:Na+ symporter
MNATINWTPLWVFIGLFILVTVLGFVASRWQSGGAGKGAHLDEWGLGGRNFGTWITWFLVGGDFYTAGGATGLTLQPAQMLPYATLALGSAMAAFMYPHTLTGIFAANSADTIRKNAIFLPAYTILLGLIALRGYMAHAAHLNVASNNDVVPALFGALFPDWFSGFAFSAIAIGALVPAAVMSIGAANLFTRNFWKPYVNPHVDPAGEAKVAKMVSLVVKIGALVCILFLPTKFALDLQLLGGVWILQTFPADRCCN